jgi:hypothetical protein
MSDRVGKDGGPVSTPSGFNREMVFTGAAGTRLTRVRYWRLVAKAVDGDWEPYTSIEGATPDVCEFGGDSACSVGADDWYAADTNEDLDRASYRDIEGLDTTAVRIGIRCRQNPAGKCGNGGTLPNASAAIYSAFFTVADPSPPTHEEPAGLGWTTGAWSQGTLALSMASSDNTGISATRVYADGSVIGTLQRSCQYTRPRPCTDEPVGAVGLPTAGLSDGLHDIEIAAVNAAGTETRVGRAQRLKVDNHAPGAPAGLVSPAPSSPTNSFSASWSLPVDAGSPITAARYQVCQSGTCGPVRTAARTTGVSDVALPAPGPATLRVWLVDELGHEDPAGSAATLALTYTPAAAPTPAPAGTPLTDPTPLADPGPLPEPGPLATPTTPTPTAHAKSPANLKLTTLQRLGRRLTVAGALAPATSGHVTVRYRVRVGARTLTFTKRAAIRHGRYRLSTTLSPTFSRATKAIVSVSYGGDRDTLAATRTAVWRLQRPRN